MSTTINVSADTSKLEETLSSSSEAISKLSEDTEDIVEYLKQIHENIQIIHDCIVHYHDAHLHPLIHFCEDRFDVGMGSPLLVTGLSLPQALVSEYNDNFDYDSNGLIYGFDFKINHRDDNRPPLLNSFDSIFNHPSFKRNLVNLSWADYLKTVPHLIAR